MSLVPEEWMPDCRMDRIICHWTAGGYRANDHDRRSYHILIERDGKLVRGIHSIADNVSTADRRYAAHTLNLNTRSIGISACCMAGARERPFEQGPCPMTEEQWQTMARVAGELCKRYDINVSPQTVLGHGEVERILRIRQNGKWDPMVLPWDRSINAQAVGDAFREMVKTYVDLSTEVQPEPLPEFTILLNDGRVGGGIMANGDYLVAVRQLCDELNWRISGAAPEVVVLLRDNGGDPVYLPPAFLDPSVRVSPTAPEADRVALMMDHGFVSVRDLAEQLGLPLEWQEDRRELVLGAAEPEDEAGSWKDGFTAYTIRAGDTLSVIAARLMGNAGRWRDIRKPDGQPFTEAEARRIRPGMVVYVPGQNGPAGGPPADPRRTAIDADLLVQVSPAVLRSYAANSIPLILAECRQSGVADRGQIAYILATSQHESNCGRHMMELWNWSPWQIRYENNAALGNTQPGDGFRFRGRGYVQLTGRGNYSFWAERLGIDLVGNPDLIVQDPALAARILVQGMRDGTFRRPHRLDRYIEGDRRDFLNARDIVNGDKHITDGTQALTRGMRIAMVAEQYLNAMGS